MSSKVDRDQSLFQALKPHCVSLLQHVRLTPTAIPIALTHLRAILAILRALPSPSTDLNPSISSYIFFPLSQILRRNESHEIPNSVLEQIMLVVSILAEFWWWSCELALWDQLLILASGILNVPAQSDAKSLFRDDETKHATVKCLWALMRPRSEAENTGQADPIERLEELQARGQADPMVPVVGRTISSLLDLTLSTHIQLQKDTLQLLIIMSRIYVHRDLAPSILPGIASVTAKVAIGTKPGGSWTNGDIIEAALTLLGDVVVKAVGDEVCLEESVVAEATTMESLFDTTTIPEKDKRPTASRPTPRTKAWLKATSTQVHMVLNSLTPLIQHPNPIALISLCSLSSELLSKARLTLPQSHSLLLMFLLIISTTSSPSASRRAHDTLLQIISPERPTSPSAIAMLRSLCFDTLIALPQAIIRRADVKVEHLARQISAICQLAITSSHFTSPFGHLMGPNGGIEKWGWGLLSILDLDLDNAPWASASPALLLTDVIHPFESFPPVRIKHMISAQSLDAVEGMFRKLGEAAGDKAIYSVEWFLDMGLGGRANALWCASLLLEGMAGVSLRSPEEHTPHPSASLEKLIRSLVRNIAEVWDDDPEPPLDEQPPPSVTDEDGLIVEHRRGFSDLTMKLDGFMDKQSERTTADAESQAIMLQVFSLHLIAISSAILGPRFSASFLHSLYPLLHAVVSSVGVVSVTGAAALQRVAFHTAYADAGNCLLSNFDYILDNVTQRLTRLRLEPQALKVLSLLITLVGSEIVSRAGDVIEECFDRLDDFHGYSIFAEGLVDVLSQVIQAIDTSTHEDVIRRPAEQRRQSPYADFQVLQSWFRGRSARTVDSSKESPSCEVDVEDPEVPAGNPTQAEPDKVGQANQEQSNNIFISLISQLTSRSLPFLTHNSPIIRAKILGLLAAAAGLLPDMSLLPSVYKAWPYVLNRLEDKETHVVAAAAAYIETLSRFAGDFTGQRVWKDVWPRYKRIIAERTSSQQTSRSIQAVRLTPLHEGTSHSWTHRLFVSILQSTLSSVHCTSVPHNTLWDIAVTLRPFLTTKFHPTTQALAIKVYKELYLISPDTLWLVLKSSSSPNSLPHRASPEDFPVMQFLQVPWDITQNLDSILT